MALVYVHRKLEILVKYELLKIRNTVFTEILLPEQDSDSSQPSSEIAVGIRKVLKEPQNTVDEVFFQERNIILVIRIQHIINRKILMLRRLHEDRAISIGTRNQTGKRHFSWCTAS